MKKSRRKVIGEEKGMRIAIFAAQLECGGAHKAAYKFWTDAAGYPCDEKNLIWRQCRADYCKQHFMKEMIWVL